MSAFTEAQIRQIAREELRKILDAGLMYTAECKPPTTETAKQHPLSGLPKELSDILEATREGNIWKIKNTTYIKPNDFKELCEIFKQQGGKWNPATNNEHGYWSIPT